MGEKWESQTRGQCKVPSLSGFGVSSFSVSCVGISSQCIPDDPKPGISCEVAEGTGNTMCFLVLEVAQGCGAASKSKHLKQERIWWPCQQFCFSAEWYNYFSNFSLDSITTENTLNCRRFTFRNFNLIR